MGLGDVVRCILYVVVGVGERRELFYLVVGE